MQTNSRSDISDYIALLSSIFILFLVGTFVNANNIHPQKYSGYRELSYSSFSPLGKIGGSIFPASGESNPVPATGGGGTTVPPGPVDPWDCYVEGTCPPPEDFCAYNSGSECAVSNACGQQGFGSITCSGECTASAPPNPSYYLTPCTSSPNTCGLRNFGSTQCDQTCSATFPPAEISCTTLNIVTNEEIDGKIIPAITIMANPKFTGLNGFSDLTWVGNGSCNLYDNDGTIIASSTSGTLRIGPVARSVRYILSCGTQNVSVTVAPSTTFQEF